MIDYVAVTAMALGFGFAMVIAVRQPERYPVGVGVFLLIATFAAVVVTV